MDNSRAMPAAAPLSENNKQTDLKLVANDNQKVSSGDKPQPSSSAYDDLDDMWDNMPV